MESRLAAENGRTAPARLNITPRYGTQTVANTTSSKTDSADSKVKHALVTQYLRDRILNQKLPPRLMLESESELCERFGVSRGPVRQALVTLEHEGLIHRHGRRGSFVADHLPHIPQKTEKAEHTTNLWMFPIGTLSTTSYMLSPLLRGLEQGAGQVGAALIVSSLETDSATHPLIQQGNVTGLFACAGEPRVIHDQAFASLPKVWLMTRRDTHQDNWDAVSPDNDAIGRMAAEYLIKRGCKKLAFLNPMLSDSSAANRYPGFLTEAYRNDGVTVHVLDDADRLDFPRTAPIQRFSLDKLKFIVDRLLAIEPRPTGVFVPSDQVTASLQPMLQQRGVEVGREMILISCNNDLSALAACHPRPATIDMNCEEIGRQAARIMACRVADKADFPWINVLVPPKLIEPANDD